MNEEIESFLNEYKKYKNDNKTITILTVFDDNEYYFIVFDNLDNKYNNTKYILENNGKLYIFPMHFTYKEINEEEFLYYSKIYDIYVSQWTNYNLTEIHEIIKNV